MSQVFEAVILLDQGSIARELRYSEFESVLDGFVPEVGYANKALKAVYLQLAENLSIDKALFFRLAFDRQGLADRAWNLPLSQLAAQGELIGEVRIFTAKHNQNKQWQSYLWDPGDDLPSLIQLIQHRLQQNRLGFFVRQVSATVKKTESVDQASTQQLLALKQEYDQSVKEKDQLKAKVASSAAALAELQQRFKAQSQELQELNKEHLYLFNNLARVSNLSDQSLARIADLQQQYSQLQQDSQSEIHELEMQIMQLEVEAENFQQQLQEHKEQVMVEYSQQLQQAKVKLSVWIAGEGEHLLDVRNLTSYLSDPERYAAQVCGVSLSHYKQWLKHYNDPLCSHCGKTAARITNPSDYIQGFHNFCDLHQIAFGKKPE